MLSYASGALAAGLAMGAASILSIGPNNILLVREGLVGGRVGLVASTVWASYLVLLVSAFLLTDRIATHGAAVRPMLSWLGMAAVAWFAFLSLRSAVRSASGVPHGEFIRETTPACVVRVLGILWLNPLTYIELLLIPAAMGSNFKMSICRLLFMAGLLVMATTACYGYTFGGKLCASLFQRYRLLRFFDLGSGILLSCMALLMAGALFIRAE